MYIVHLEGVAIECSRVEDVLTLVRALAEHRTCAEVAQDKSAGSVIRRMDTRSDDRQGTAPATRTSASAETVPSAPISIVSRRTTKQRVLTLLAEREPQTVKMLNVYFTDLISGCGTILSRMAKDDRVVRQMRSTNRSNRNEHGEYWYARSQAALDHAPADIPLIKSGPSAATPEKLRTAYVPPAGTIAHELLGHSVKR